MPPMAPMPPGPPPPPPPPGRREGGGAPAFVNLSGGPPPPPNIRPGPPPPPPGFQPQPQQQRPQVNNTRIVDITPRKPLDEDACRKRLTNYEAHTIRKIAPRDLKEKATWAKSEITREPLSQEDISKAVKRLNESRRSVKDKKDALMPFQQGQVNRLLDELMTREHDQNFEWSLSQLDSKTFINKKGQKETSTITVYVKRAPLKDLNPIGLFNAIERNKQQRMEQLNRPPPPQPAGERLDDPIVRIEKGGFKDFGKGPKLNRPKKKYHDHDRSSISSDYSDSDSESESEYTSDGHTTISTHSDRHPRKYSHKGRSQSRRREHRKKYYVDERMLSPEPIHRNSLPYGAVPRYVPEVQARVIPTAVPAFDAVAAAYQAGKIDADAERFGVDRYPRRSIVEPQAIVSYGRPERVERIYPEPRYEYVDEREEDYLRREDRLRREERRAREAEEYMDRRARDSRLEPEIIYTSPNPFAPLPTRIPRHYSYTPSHSTRDGYR
jgi:hypothetical protein